MDELGLFTAALGLSEPWWVARTEFDAEGARLDLYLEFGRGAQFPCPATGCAHGGCPVHDTADKTWRHLDFFGAQGVPARPGTAGALPASMGCGRSACPGRGRAQGSQCCFQALVLTFAAATGVAKVAAMTREHDTRIWRVVEHHVHAARDQQDFSGVRKVGMDETSAHKGQDYVSIFADMQLGRALFATEGRSADTVARFAADPGEHGGDPKQITDTSSDMSTAFIAGIGQHLPNATMTFDRYHLAAKLSEAVDQVRRTEVHTRPELQHTRWLWLKNYSNLSATQRRELHQLMRPSAKLATARALRWREDSPHLLRPAPQLRARVPATLVLRRETLPPAAHQRLRRPRRKPLGWHHRLARQPPDQRPARRNQLPGPGS